MKWFSNSCAVCPPNQMKNMNLYWQIVSSSMPLSNSKSMELCSYYHWNDPPPSEYILRHLENIKQCRITADEKIKFASLIKSVYQCLEQNFTESVKESIICNGLVWTDETFVKPSKILVHSNANDLQLKPYFHVLPADLLSLETFFVPLGCYNCQDEYVLARVLKRIEKKYRRTELFTPLEKISDQKMCLQVLERLADKCLDQEWVNENVLVVIESENEATIEFAKLTHCVYDDDPCGEIESVIEDHNIRYVNANIPYNIAHKLGIPSLNRRALMDAENIEEWGQREKFTRRIKTLLDEGYTDGISVPKELLQNADDAGATQVCFVYDKRKNLNFRKRLISKHLADFQGEAMWCYNNQVFSERDLTNIKQFNDSLKKSDTSTIGKFGLGFTSVYNLTDLPSFITGKHMVMFDPHEKFLEDDTTNKSPRGKKIPLSKRALVKRHVDQFQPFEGLFDCNVIQDPFTQFSGTLFRFPLRTAKQADESDISKKVYRHEDVIHLLELLIRNADMLLLFTQHVSTIKILYLAEDACSTVQLQEIFKINKDVFRRNIGIDSILLSCVLQQAANECKTGRELNEMHIVQIKQTLTHDNMLFSQIILPCSDATWLITWFMDCDHMDEQIHSPPLVAIATPCVSKDDWTLQNFDVVHAGAYLTGHVFCFLPLPIGTGFAFHVNGCFHVSSDRRMLTIMTADDQSDGHNSKLNRWNKVLFQSSLVRALLKHVLATNSNSEKPYFLWPNETVSDSVKPLVYHFYRAVVDLNPNPKVFHGTERFLSFNEIIILDPVILKDPNIGSDALQFVKHIPINNSKVAISVPDFIAQNLRYFNADREQTVEGVFIHMEQMLLHFLKNADNKYWDENQMAYSRFLRYAILCDDSTVLTCLQTTNCIRTDPNGTLRMIKDLVHPSSNLSQLFADSDERFISNSNTLRDKKILARLVELGMISDLLPPALLIDRCNSIESIAIECNHCARERLKILLKYLSNSEVDSEILDKVNSFSFLPVLSQPTEWPFKWHSSYMTNDILCFENKMCSAHESNISEPLRLGKPKSLFRMNCSKCVGSVCHILDENHSVFPNIYEKLGVCNQMDFTIDMLLNQLSIVGNELIEFGHAYDNETKSILSIIYSALDKLSINMTTREFQSHAEKYPSVLSKPIIDVGNDVVPISKVAKNMTKSCSPDLFELPSITRPEHLRVFEKFGVKEYFCVSDIIRVLEVKSKENRELCVDNVINLLINLEWCMRQENITYEQLLALKENIIAPDTKGQLWPTYTLALDDNELSSREPLRLLHEGIPPMVAKAVGVKSKRIQLIKRKTRVIPFGQHEKLTTRLRGLLKDYPCDDSIMKELIQNADDAGASEINFIKYYEIKSIGRSVENGDKLQPALCVFNDTYFREKDFEGIKNLGIGSKTDDSFKTGKFGVGFNAVYHITDMPSFQTKGPGLGQLGQVCIFDPLLKTIGEISEGEPGIRYGVQDLLEDFPDSTLGYPPIIGDCGTMFRLPLRSEPSEISGHCMSKDNVDNILDSFVVTMAECLQFVKNLRKIKVLQFENGKYTELYKVESELTEDDTNNRANFFQHIKEVCSLDEEVIALRKEQFSVTYKMNILDSKGENETWLVVNKFGSSDTLLVEQMISHINNDDRSLLPVGGVSLKLSKFGMKLNTDESNRQHTQTIHKKWMHVEGKPYCFLPLTGITGLPFHVNGHFAVDRGRRGLWREEQGYRKQWNEFLLHGVVTECIYEALLFLQNYWINNNMPNLQELSLRNEYLAAYFSHFPNEQNTTDAYWKGLVKELYAIMIRKCWKVFPFVVKNLTTQSALDNDSGSLCISWIHLATDQKSINGGLVNSLYKYNASEDAFNIENVLKNLGIQITETPLDVIKRIKQTGQTSIVYTEPIVVMQIVKDRLLDHGRSLKATVLISIEVVKSLLKCMLQCKTFDEDLLGLPLCVTNNMILNVFGKECFFCSDYCDLVPGSSQLFVHGSLVSLLKRPKLLERGILKEFTVHDLHQQLPVSYDPSVYRAGSNMQWKNTETSCVTPEFISRLFCFMQETQTCRLPQENSDLQGQILKAVEIFSDWSFLPSIENTASGNTYLLIPFNKAHTLLEEPKMDDICPLLSKLQIPRLDTAVLRNCKDVSITISQMIASEMKPDVLLQCLYHNRFRFKGLEMKSKEATQLLLYFMQYQDTILAKLDRDAKLLLKSLPLYETIDGIFVSLPEQYEILVISKQIPCDGLDDLTRGLRTCILKQNNVVHKLYNFLDLKHCDRLKIYNDKIIPNIDRMQKHHWLAHITFLKDILTSYSLSLSHLQGSIVLQMKNLPFIKINENYYIAMQLYNRDHPVFQTMSDFTSDITFLPSEFMDGKWKEFMITLGLIVKPTGEMLIQFARILEEKGTRGLANVLKEKSTILVNCLSNERFSGSELQTISKINFVVPYEVPGTFTNIVPALRDPAQFMCLEGSCHSKHMEVCWSTVPLFQPVFCLETMYQLNIKMKPNVDDVIGHIKRMCSVFHDSNNFPNKIERMKPLYQYLSELSSWQPKSCCENLKDTPCILIDDRSMVIPSMVFVSSSSSDEIRPYLYKAAKHLSCYFDMFQKLGSSADVSCAQYACVLEAIHAKYFNTPLPLHELELVSKAVTKLFYILSLNEEEDKERKNLEHLAILYLPNRSNQMCRSDELVIEDNKFYSEYIQEKRSINVFLGFRELHIDENDPVAAFQALPKKLQPRILSKDVEERVSLKNICEVPNKSIQVARFESFIRSFEFLEGLCRIIVNQMEDYDVNVDTRLNKILSNVCIKEVMELQANVVYRGENIGCLNKDYFVHIPELCLYYKTRNDADRSYLISEGVMELLGHVTEDRLSAFSFMLLKSILDFVDQPDAIWKYLDQKQIRAYYCTNVRSFSAFPKPGTYVDKKFHPFLVQAISPFHAREYEFAALVLETDDVAHDVPYIYVHIVNVIDTVDNSSLGIKYVVNVGPRQLEQQTVPIFRLYRFVQQNDQHDGVVENEDRPFEYTCNEMWGVLKHTFTHFTDVERVIILRRIILDWYAIKFQNNQGKAERVFNFLLSSVLRLENGEADVEPINENTGMSGPDISNSRFERLFTKIDETGNYYAIEFRKYIRVYIQSSRQGLFVHLSSKDSEVCSPGEYRRWLKQAKLDFRTGESVMLCTGSHPETYNWICYNFHQACEKAIKAAWFLKNANRYNSLLRSHNLVDLCVFLGNGPIAVEARSFEERLNIHNNGSSRLRYPDSVQSSNIPSDVFSKEDAEFALETARKILDEVNALSA